MYKDIIYKKVKGNKLMPTVPKFLNNDKRLFHIFALKIGVNPSLSILKYVSETAPDANCSNVHEQALAPT